MWTFAGTFGLFLTLFLLFIRFLPMIAIAEVKGVTPLPTRTPATASRRVTRAARRPSPRT